MAARRDAVLGEHGLRATCHHTFGLGDGALDRGQVQQGGGAEATLARRGPPEDGVVVLPEHDGSTRVVGPGGSRQYDLGEDELPLDAHQVHSGQPALRRRRAWCRGALGPPHRLHRSLGLGGLVEELVPDERLAQACRGLAEDLTPSGGRDLQVAVEVVDATVDFGDDRAHCQYRTDEFENGQGIRSRAA